MKTKVYIIAVIILALVSSSKAQCDDSLIDSCKTKLGETIYLKHFKVRLAKTRRKRKTKPLSFSVYLSKGTIYQFSTANDKTLKSKVIVNVFDDFKLYGNNYNKEDDSVTDSFGFICKRTGIYYITAKFKDNKEGCAVIMFSMKEHKKEYN